MTDERYTAIGCDCGDAFCGGCEDALTDRDNEISAEYHTDTNNLDEPDPCCSAWPECYCGGNLTI
jgi:hypothetical protein